MNLFLFFLVFLTNNSLAEDNLKYTDIKKGEKAPFDGKLFTKEGNQYVFSDLDEKQILSLEKTIGELTGEVSKIDTAKLFKNKTFNVNDFGNTVYKAFKNEIDKFKNF